MSRVELKFLTRESLARAARCLAARDKDLATILTAYGTPPMWARKPGFQTLIRIVLEQQVSLASARSIFGRLAARIDSFSPEGFLKLGESGLKSLGLTRQKASYCLHVAQAVMDRQLSFAALSRLSDDDARAQLTQVKGIGPWTADIYLLMVLRRADVWPSGDVALATSLAKLKALPNRPDPDRLGKMADAWRPFRSVAARMLWQYYLANRGRISR